ncbi:hypothetical protein OJAV_G00182160 [Oryzias javanicus]|uniref:Uncharacterized protein n=1 Tax=Oryzias javanicus TaxID=123683 RepID=A0A437CCQ4_ORYJA|nr:hypothetical protein OJAV_G00182160 [Oryzias javanicus]
MLRRATGFFTAFIDYSKTNNFTCDNWKINVSGGSRTWDYGTKLSKLSRNNPASCCSWTLGFHQFRKSLHHLWVGVLHRVSLENDSNCIYTNQFLKYFCSETLAQFQ